MQKIEYIKTETGFEKVIRQEISEREVEFESTILEAQVSDLKKGVSETPEKQDEINELIAHNETQIEKLRASLIIE